MMKLLVQVSPDRERTAFATLTDGGNRLAFDIAAACASPLIAKKLGNADSDPLRIGGHPPLGTYRFLQTNAVDPALKDEYGAHTLAFEPLSGTALEAESFGRLGLLVYGGRYGKDGLMRRTQGGVRLSELLLDRVVAALEPGIDLILELSLAKPPRWWAFWRTSVPTQPLSAEPPMHSSAPNDELTLLQAMLASAPRRPRKTSTDSDDDRWNRDRDRDRGSSSSDTFKGGAGEFGGAGASGRWDAPGVDQAGRIVAAGAAGAAIAGIAAAAAARDGASHSSELIDTNTGTAY